VKARRSGAPSCHCSWREHHWHAGIHRATAGKLLHGSTRTKIVSPRGMYAAWCSPRASQWLLRYRGACQPCLGEVPAECVEKRAEVDRIGLGQRPIGEEWRWQVRLDQTASKPHHHYELRDTAFGGTSDELQTHHHRHLRRMPRSRLHDLAP
jgi:hypothetical protein